VITGEARDTASGVAVEVGPCGGLRALTLAERSLRLGGDALATAILDLVHTATAQANRRARNALPGGLDDLRDADLDAIGVGVDAELAEVIEQTTPDTWMR
jgi:hypothetical protein